VLRPRATAPSAPLVTSLMQRCRLQPLLHLATYSLHFQRLGDGDARTVTVSSFNLIGSIDILWFV